MFKQSILNLYSILSIGGMGLTEDCPIISSITIRADHYRTLKSNLSLMHNGVRVESIGHCKSAHLPPWCGCNASLNLKPLVYHFTPCFVSLCEPLYHSCLFLTISVSQATGEVCSHAPCHTP